MPASVSLTTTLCAQRSDKRVTDELTRLEGERLRQQQAFAALQEMYRKFQEDEAGIQRREREEMEILRARVYVVCVLFCLAVLCCRCVLLIASCAVYRGLCFLIICISLFVCLFVVSRQQMQQQLDTDAQLMAVLNQRPTEQEYIRVREEAADRLRVRSLTYLFC